MGKFHHMKIYLNKSVKKQTNWIMAQRFSILDHRLVIKIKQAENQIQKCIIYINFFCPLFIIGIKDKKSLLYLA